MILILLICCKNVLIEFIKASLDQVLGLDICADIIIGDEMIRGISGGQKKRVTTGMHSKPPLI